MSQWRSAFIEVSDWAPTLEYRIVVLGVYYLFQNFLVTLDEVRYFHLLILRVASVWTFIRFYPFIKIF